ncbi:universal stress protein [Limnoraphis robusta Tam1]|uniref:Universal stress protein n=1 Tax=Limnoraphis robusta CS-951 TaxID=1637645 RepID=A0A0F5YJR8_9CYAN|nr:universal stress protein [Limnoraphis robusta]KKD39111.1 universal stress protein [Limnoraphis robusta CS-951]MEA5500428.1 universal stress protein [Limnoraphis robusta BA-68 BA1]MEA5537858.1 universal stress protein [Limnoraphis robusta Tam1]
MKKILLCTDGSIFAENIYRYGAWLATGLGAEVQVLSVTDIRSQQVASTGNLSGSIGLGASEDLLKQLVDLEHEKAKINNQRAKLILQTAEQSLKSAGVEQVQLIHKTGFLVDCFYEFEAESDLIVLGKRGEAAEFASGHLGANMERIVRSSHKPCFVTPREFKPINRMLVAYDGSSTGKRILQFLIHFPLFKGLELHLLKVTKTENDSSATARIDEARNVLKTAGIEANYQLKVGESEKIIAQYINDQEISLLLMGAYGHSRIRHLVIGSTTAQVLRSSHIPVLLFR